MNSKYFYCCLTVLQKYNVGRMILFKKIKNTYVKVFYKLPGMLEGWKNGEVIPKCPLIRVIVEEGRRRVREKGEGTQGKKNDLKKK